MNKFYHKFEAPYNFDFSLTDYYSQHLHSISFVYLPPYKEDAINTRTIYENSKKGSIGYTPNSRREYIKHLSYFKKNKIDFCILWQDKKPIKHETIKFYQDFGVTGFVVADDTNASVIKSYNEDFLLISSITRKLTYNDLLCKDFLNYDYIVLFFPFTRAIEALKSLNSLKEKLVIMPNTICFTDCFATHHWFPVREKLKHDSICYGPDNMDKCCFIYPEYLYLFDDFIGGYKLQGREYTTNDIMKNAASFFNRCSSENLIEPETDFDLKRRISEMNAYNYYNLKSNDVMFSEV